MADTVHLKSLSLKGFKSFADPTSLEFEPGVTVIVGPNGSGKSNVVDAVAWVLGAQGPRVVRSSKMDDVIFAGTTKRAPLGRAEVTLTIDNSSRRLPVDLAEVTITRTLFRTGESEYSMNGAACRLLDIQEMLSDAGVGRQQHVIMGQGQLDGILAARPEDRRLVIEEAAGVLKYRRRRERAERRLEATEQHLVRLHDLEREVRRQLRPLERQAEAARRHGALAAELRALRLHLAGRELEALERRRAEADGQAEALEAEESRLFASLGRLDELVSAAEAALSAVQQNDLAGPHFEAERLYERADGLARLIAERRRSVAAALAASTDAGVVAALESEAARLAGEIDEAEASALLLAPEWERIEHLLQQLAEEEADLAPATEPPGSGHAAEVSSRRKERDSLMRQGAAARETLARHTERAASLERQREELERSLAGQRRRVADLAREVDRSRWELEAAEAAEREAAEAVAGAEARSRAASEVAHSLSARRHALQVALDEAQAKAGMQHLASLDGVLGTLLDVVEVDSGCEKAFEAAAEDALGAVVMDGRHQAVAAVEHLRRSGIDGAVLVAGHRPHAAPVPVASTQHDGFAEPLRRRVRGTTERIETLLDVLLAGVVLCRGDLGEALGLTATTDVVVTLEGDRFSSRGWRLGAGRAGATRAALESVQAESERAEREAALASTRAETAREAHASVRGDVRGKGRGFEADAAELRQSQARLEEGDHRLERMAEQLAAIAAPRRAAEAELAGIESALGAAEGALGEAEERERSARAVAEEASRRRTSFGERARAVAAARSELEVRAAGIEERRSLLLSRQNEIERRLGGHAEERANASQRRRGYERTDAVLRALEPVVASAREELAVLRAELGEARRRHEATVGEISTRLRGTRENRTATERELTSVRERSQRAELQRAEVRVRLEAAVESLRHELEVEPEDARAMPCPDLPPGTPAEARARELEREIRLMGPVNPLAMEELVALVERDQFLTSQLEDVRSTRRELGRVIRAVDDEIVDLFGEAFADVSRHFEALFSTLFPGGTGRLTLLDPTDLLSTGVEIEARPAGRNVRRLSLLSGGERSLVALAFLFAVFRSRPSPFYLMDEVEAALDDVNLHRFLDLVDEFRGEAQLLIVSHQKRTMESADVLYGVSMQPGGASKVVSERLAPGRLGRGEPARTA